MSFVCQIGIVAQGFRQSMFEGIQLLHKVSTIDRFLCQVTKNDGRKLLLNFRCWMGVPLNLSLDLTS